MLREIQNVSQHKGELPRRGFQCADIDLFLWERSPGEIEKFQLAYDKLGSEKLLAWDSSTGIRNNQLDDGTSSGHYPAAPIVVSAAELDVSRIRAKFASVSSEIDPSISEFIFSKLSEYESADGSEIEYSEQLSAQATPAFTPLAIIIGGFLVIILLLAAISHYGH